MSNLTTVVNSIVSKVNTHTTDLSNKATQISTHIPLSGITAYHLLQGNLAVSNYTITQGFNTTLYTGNGGTQSINTGIDMNTQWGNDASEKFGGLVWIKSRTGTQNNALTDTVRGNTKIIQSNLTNAESTSSILITSFNNNGISLGSDNTVNGAFNYVSWNFQTTHRVTGTTNHGKAYTCHYNPYTGFTIVKYEGSGIAGHKIPHMLGRKLGFVNIKCLTNGTEYWQTGIEDRSYAINSANAFVDFTGEWSFTDSNITIKNGGVALNASANQYIMYGWANSYLDESDTLIGNYEIGVYQGTGASGNKVTTRGKPAWVMIKRLDSTGSWMIFDNQRGVSTTSDALLRAELSNAEITGNYITFNSDGFTHDGGWDGNTNTSGGRYLYMVAYDTNSNGGGSYYPLASDTANLQVNNALIPIAQGIDSNGAKNTILSKNETFSGVTYTQGKNYVYYDALGNRGVSNKAPNYGLTNPSNGGDFYNVLSNKWFTSAGTEITNGRNYLNHIVYADNDGGVLYVEELPKIEYKDTVQVDSLKILSGFDLGQTWKDVTASRVSGVTYTNTTGKPIYVSVYTYGDIAGGVDAALTIDGKVIAKNSTADAYAIDESLVQGIVPNGSTYSYGRTTGTSYAFFELR